MENFDLVAVFDLVQTQLAFFFQQQQVSFDPDIPEYLFINMNKFVVRIIIHNLLANAIKYALPASEITFTLDTEADCVLLLCENATTQVELARLAQGDAIINVTPVAQHDYSSGNGLSIVKQLTQSLGGTYEVFIEDSSVCIRVLLPYEQVGDEHA